MVGRKVRLEARCHFVFFLGNRPRSTNPRQFPRLGCVFSEVRLSLCRPRAGFTSYRWRRRGHQHKGRMMNLAGSPLALALRWPTSERFFPLPLPTPFPSSFLFPLLFFPLPLSPFHHSPRTPPFPLPSSTLFFLLGLRQRGRGRVWKW